MSFYYPVDISTTVFSRAVQYHAILHGTGVIQRRLDTLTDLHGTPCHVWLVKITRSTWRRLSKCVFVLALLRALDPVGAPYSVRG